MSSLSRFKPTEPAVSPGADTMLKSSCILELHFFMGFFYQALTMTMNIIAGPLILKVIRTL